MIISIKDTTIPETIETRTVELRREQFFIQTIISNEIGGPFDIHLSRRVLLDLGRSFAYRLRLEVLTENPEEQLSVSYPATWRDAFKEHWFPKIENWLWPSSPPLLKWFPVRWRTQTLYAKVLYPYIKPSVSNRSPVVRFYTRERIYPV